MASLYSIYRYTGTGAPQLLPVPPYLDKSHIRVYVNGALNTSWGWATGATISLTAPALAPIVIKRDTSPGTRLVDYQGAVPLTEADLDIDSLQAFYLGQEAKDVYNDLVSLSDAPLQDAITAAVSANTSAAAAAASADAATEAALARATRLNILNFMTPVEKLAWQAGAVDCTAALVLAVAEAATYALSTGAAIEFPGPCNYRHDNVVISSSGVFLVADGTARLEKTSSSGRGIEFKAIGWDGNPATNPARIFHCGVVGFQLGNAFADGTAGENLYFENVTGLLIKENRYSAFPYKPWNAIKLRRCTDIRFIGNAGNSAVSTGFVFIESGGIRGGYSHSHTCGAHGFEFDTCTGNQLVGLEGYGNLGHAFKVHASGSYALSVVSAQSAFFFPTNWVADTSADHNFLISDTRIGVMTACWASDNSTETPNKYGFAFAGKCYAISVLAGSSLKNNGEGAYVAPTCLNVNFFGGQFLINGEVVTSTNRAGIVHQGTGVIVGVRCSSDFLDAAGVPVPGLQTNQQYGVVFVPGNVGNFMRIRDCDLTGNVLGGMVTSDGLTNFEESGNNTGASYDVASATSITCPVGRSYYHITGPVDIYDIFPKWKGRRVTLIFESTARLIGAGGNFKLETPTVTPGQYGSADLICEGTVWIALKVSVNDNT